MKKFSVEAVRKTHPRAYLPWTPKEDDVLLMLLNEGHSVESIAGVLERQEGAILSRLAKLEVGVPSTGQPPSQEIVPTRPQHASEVSEPRMRVERAAETPRCPRCDSPLVLRKRRAKRFWTCSAYREKGCEMRVETHWNPELGVYPFVPPANLDLTRKPQPVSCPDCGSRMRYRRSTRTIRAEVGTSYAFFCRHCKRILPSDAKYPTSGAGTEAISSGGHAQKGEGLRNKKRIASNGDRHGASSFREGAPSPLSSTALASVPLAQDQERIASLPSGVHCVIAGPGSGKTRTMVGRVVHLLKSGVDPTEIVLLSHTRAARHELEERLGRTWYRRLGGVSTFHALARQLLQKADVDIANLDVNDYPSHLMKLVRSGLELPAFQHLIIDEFQDTSDEQLAMLARLMRNAESVIVVGDPNQAIFTWAGVNQDVFGTFERSTPRTQRHVLGRSYRCSEAVLDLAKWYMVDPYKLEPASSGGDAEHILFSHLEEIVGEVESRAGGQDAAILTRTNDQASQIRPMLTREIEVMTIHKSKGREWNSVAVITRNADRDNEEKKVSFVAVTRARSTVTVFEEF